MRTRNNYFVLIAIVSVIVGIETFFHFFDPVRIVDFLGVEHTYLIIFLLAALGGISTVTGVALFATLATFAAGGANIFLLALAGGAGIFISDSIFYFLAYYGRKAVPKTWERKLQRIETWMDRHPKKTVLGAMYIYIGFTPLPNDLLMIALVIGGYTYRQIVWVLLAGSFTIALLTAYLASAFYS